MTADVVNLCITTSLRRDLVVGSSAGSSDGRSGIVAVGVDSTGTSGGRGVVTGVGASWLNLLVDASGAADGSTSVGSVVAWASVRVGNSEARGSSAELSLASGVLILASKESLASGAGSVAVGWAGSEALLLLVVADEHNVHDGGEQENDATDNGDGEASLVHAASSAVVDTVGNLIALGTVGAEAETNIVKVCANGGADDARAGARAIASQHCESNEDTNEGNVENDADEAEEADAGKAAGQEHSQDGVENRCTSKAFYCLRISCNEQIAIGEDSEEVAVNSEDDGSAAERDEVERCLHKAQKTALDDTHDVGWLR